MNPTRFSSRYLRARVRSVCTRFANYQSGFVFGSYSLKDEIALAKEVLTRNASGKQRKVLIDAGAHDGRYASAILEAMGDSAFKKLLVVEPNPAHTSALAALGNGLTCLSHAEVVLGEESGRTNLFTNQQHSALSSIYARDLDHVGIDLDETIPVAMTTLDQLCSDHEIEHIDYLKLDLEGHEFAALKGARRLLLENRISALIFEFGGTNIDSRTFLKDFWRLLHIEHGFELYRLCPSRTLIHLDRYSESLEQFQWQNVLALPTGSVPPWPLLN